MKAERKAGVENVKGRDWWSGRMLNPFAHQSIVSATVQDRLHLSYYLIAIQILHIASCLEVRYCILESTDLVKRKDTSKTLQG